MTYKINRTNYILLTDDIKTWPLKFGGKMKEPGMKLLTEEAQNCPFLILIILPVLAAAKRRSVCSKKKEVKLTLVA